MVRRARHPQHTQHDMVSRRAEPQHASVQGRNPGDVAHNACAFSCLAVRVCSGGAQADALLLSR
eukprot:1299972-Prymnesium_polylepis.1